MAFAAVFERLGFGGPVVAIRQSVNVDPPSAAAATVTYSTITVTDIPAELVGASEVTINPTANLTAGVAIVGPRVSAANTIAYGIINATAGAIDLAAQDFVISVHPVNPLP